MREYILHFVSRSDTVQSLGHLSICFNLILTIGLWFQNNPRSWSIVTCRQGEGTDTSREAHFCLHWLHAHGHVTFLVSIILMLIIKQWFLTLTPPKRVVRHIQPNTQKTNWSRLQVCIKLRPPESGVPCLCSGAALVRRIIQQLQRQLSHYLQKMPGANSKWGIYTSLSHLLQNWLVEAYKRIIGSLVLDSLSQCTGQTSTNMSH